MPLFSMPACLPACLQTGLGRRKELTWLSMCHLPATAQFGKLLPALPSQALKTDNLYIYITGLLPPSPPLTLGTRPRRRALGGGGRKGGWHGLCLEIHAPYLGELLSNPLLTSAKKKMPNGVKTQKMVGGTGRRVVGQSLPACLLGRQGQQCLEGHAWHSSSHLPLLVGQRHPVTSWDGAPASGLLKAGGCHPSQPSCLPCIMMDWAAFSALHALGGRKDRG